MGRPPMPIGTFGNIPPPRNVGPSKYQAKTWFRDADGIVRRVSAIGQTKGAAAKTLKERLLKRQLEVQSAVVTHSTTVAELADVWFAQGQWASNTVDTYRYVIANQVKPELGAVRLNEVRPALVIRALTRIRDTAGPGSAKTAKTVLSGMFDHAVTHDAISANPARVKVSIPRTTRKGVVRALTPAEVDVLCDGLRSDPVAVRGDLPDLVDWMLGTGARIGEAIAARPDSLDLEHGTWEINATLIRLRGEGLVVQLRPKTAAGWRKLALPPYCVAMLQRRDDELRMQPATFRVLNERKQLSAVPGPVAFPAPSSRALRDPRNTNRDLRDALDRLGFEWVTSHVFRKTVATRLDEAKLSPRQVADQLGHAKPSMTQDVYMGRNVVSAEAARILDR